MSIELRWVKRGDSLSFYERVLQYRKQEKGHPAVWIDVPAVDEDREDAKG